MSVTQSVRRGMLLPRMSLHRPPRGGFISKAKLAARFEDFSHGRWQKLIDAGRHCVEEAATAVSRKRHRTNQQSDIERRAVRAQSLVQLGELSAGRQALEGAVLAPGSIQTRQELSNPQRRPPHPREPLSADLLTFQPASAFELDKRKFSKISGLSGEALRQGHRACLRNTFVQCWKRPGCCTVSSGSPSLWRQHKSLKKW